MIGTELASELLDFGARMDSPERARQQLEGAVALHNLLERHGVAYLADEVGMGKTLVALGVIALFRHFDPKFRVLVIAPRENIQRKWAKEMRVFAGRNVRFSDLRVRGLGEVPARPLVHAESLLKLLRETALDPDRDFFARLTSFSLQMGESDEDWTRVRIQLRGHLPWLGSDALDLRGHRQRKDNIARAVCCGLPTFDLVIVDEAHNLKHGFSEHSAARNRVLGISLGHPRGNADLGLFPGYGPRARRVLFLSATPIEETYRHLWNQLDVFGLGDKFGGLIDDEIAEENKKAIAGQFLIRRVTTIRTAGDELTKNQYRREWRRGGLAAHDEPIRITDDRERLTLALVQKKVSEVLNTTRFKNQFQIGMLASFESFLQTAKLKRSEDEAANFDDAEQTELAEEREGIDVRDLNRLASSHFRAFGTQMPHPKMDALVKDLQSAWKTGRKALVFVRRVASVTELVAKLEESYDAWLIPRLHDALPESLHPRFDAITARYAKHKQERFDGRDSEEGGTFFSWFFHGEGPPGVLSGANIQRRFTQSGAVYSTFFDDNDVATLLGVRPGAVTAALVDATGKTEASLREHLRVGTARFLGNAKKVARSDRFFAVQAAAVELLVETAGHWQDQARVIWTARYRDRIRRRKAAPPEIGDYLELPTFFTELRTRTELCSVLWPEPRPGPAPARFHEKEVRAQLLASAARLGHAFLDFYALAIGRIGSFEPRAQADDDSDDRGMIDAYLDLLDDQRRRADREWCAFDELASIAENYDLIVDVNTPELRSTELSEIPRKVGDLLGAQHPIGGMAGEVNQTLIRQFRLPGYPFALITTDLLQEGEDLHPFCAAVYHYGISWTPSAMEQRIGRIDRVRSHTDRRLTGRAEAPGHDELLQVYFPHLEDTVEVLQVRRVIERMNTFLRLMHRGLGTSGTESRRLDVSREMVGGLPPLERITGRLESAFPVDPSWLVGRRTGLAVPQSYANDALARFCALRSIDHSDVPIVWETEHPQAMLLGTASLGKRQQPFALYLRTLAERLVVRCVSPVGRTNASEKTSEIKAAARQHAARIGAIELLEDQSYDLTVEDDVLLGGIEHDRSRVCMLIDRVISRADRLELELLESDQPMHVFRADLEHDRNLTDE